MAAKAAHYGRRLIVFLVALAAMYGLVALSADWKPKLGLDLQGGTRISLQARTEANQNPPAEQLTEARGIIDSRVNGSGVAEAEVTTQGGQNIVVEIPGETEAGLADTISRSAQLYFRLVADVPVQYMVPPGTELPTESPSAKPGKQGKQGKGKQGQGKQTPSAKPSATASPQGRALSGGLLAADESPSGTPTSTPTGTPTGAPTGTPTGTPQPTASPTPIELPTTGKIAKGSPVAEYMKFQASPPAEWLEAYQAYVCPAKDAVANVKDDPTMPLIACDEAGGKYLMTPAPIEGKELSDATWGTPPQGVGWQVNLEFRSRAATTFRDVTAAIDNSTGQGMNQNGSQKAFAIVLDGEVLSTPVVSNGPIAGGKAEISGDFTQDEARSLATSLKYGALPLKFIIGEVSEEGPTLAGDQLRGGLLAGALGLGLVLIYCLVYYRGLGLVVLASLGLAAAITYATVLLLAEAAGFTLTLPGIAGLIVGVGITADSFIVYFERMRDEMREGKSMRVAVETGWVRARNTCLAADAVSLLCGIVLYIFAIGVVKGFAFALVVSTVIDLVVFFWFTKPMVSWLASFRFFNTGHKLSGLSAEAVGIERIGSRRAAGGTA